MSPASDVGRHFEATVGEYDGSITNDYGVGETKNSTISTASESKHEGPDYIEHRTKADDANATDAAQQKQSRHYARMQPGAKRGGRRQTIRGGWGRLPRRKKRQFEPGDLVEAEWAGSGWWYVGYVGGRATKGEQSSGPLMANDGSRTKDEYHVHFVDGDEADILGRELKLLEATGEAGAGNSIAALPRHVPVADLGPGILYRNIEPTKNRPQNSRGQDNAIRQQNRDARDKTDGLDTSIADNDTRNGNPREHLRRGSAGNIDGRQGESAVRGGSSAALSGVGAGRGISSPGSGGGGGWWETGTPYAFQPRLAAKPTVLSFLDAAVRRHHSPGLGRSGVPTRKSGGDDHDGITEPRADSGGTALASQRGRSSSEGGELMRFVKAPESNDDHGKRIFFVA